MAKYNNEPYLRSEDFLKNGKYTWAPAKIVDVVTGCPLTRRLKPVVGVGLRFDKSEKVPAIGDKVLGLVQTNESLLRVVIGDAELSTAIGKTVILAVRIIKGKNGEEPALRIMPPKGTLIRGGLARQLGRDPNENTEETK